MRKRYAIPLSIAVLALVTWTLLPEPATPELTEPTAESHNRNFIDGQGLLASDDPALASRPNIVLIVADDLGIGHLGAYGQKHIKTPNLDRIAREGMLFSQFYSASTVCAPSRSGLLEGRHTGHTSIRGNASSNRVLRTASRLLPKKSDTSPLSPPAWMRPLFFGVLEEQYREASGEASLPANSFTLGRMLQQSGYRTAAIGKWGLGGPGTSGEPQRQGFDEFFGLLSHLRAHNHFPHEVWQNGRRLSLDNPYYFPHQTFSGDAANPKDSDYNQGLFEEWFDDRATEEALQFMQSNTDQPFFLYLSYLTPHAALQAPSQAIDEQQAKFEPEPYVSQGAYLSRYNPHAVEAAMVSKLDENIGALVDDLESRGEADNTLIIIMSDNGPAGEGGLDIAFFDANGPFRGKKRDLYEGGIRSPLIVWWPGQVEAGRRSDHLAAAWDIMPTLADVAGVTLTHYTDGLSILPELVGRGEQGQRRALYWEFHEGQGSQAVRHGRWKAVRLNAAAAGQARLELYDLEADPGETRDISLENPAMAKQMAEMMDKMRAPSNVPEWNLGK